MAKVLFRKEGSIVVRTFEDNLAVEQAQELVDSLTRIFPKSEWARYKFFVELDPSERADWYVSYKKAHQINKLETTPSLYPYLYTCSICECRVASNTQLHLVCPACSNPLNGY